MELGAVELLVIGFPENRFTGKITPALADLVDKGTIRVIDLIFISKDEEGTIVGFELSSVDEATRQAFEPLLANPDPLLHDDDIADVGEALEPGSSAAMILFEHTWANEFRRALVGAGGELIDSFRIAPETIEGARVALAEGGD
ncbi:MAG: DUF6325 family protein [Acidimicrobiia bacterium]